MSTVEQKSLLAKLMAAENITVEHKQARTARFHLTSRTLTCPIWKEMDGDLYDLLLGHEISHALHTPPEGWHDAIESSPKKKAFRSFLNVVEDARIEKFLKNKYPGIRKPMMRGYKTLLERDFFGISSVDNVNDLYLIDKLNLAAKLGSLIDIRFKDEEKPFYKRLMDVHTWEDVTKLAYDLFQYSKKEQEEGEKKKEQEYRDHMQDMQDQLDEEEAEQEEYEDDYEEGDEEEDENGDSYSDGGDESEDGEDEGVESEDEDNGEDGEEDKKDDEGEDADSSEEEEKAKARAKHSDKQKKSKEKKDKGEDKNKGGNTDAGSTGEFNPRARTDEKFREKENDLVETSDVEHVYVNIPRVKLSDAVTPAKIVNNGIKSTAYTTEEQKRAAFQLYADFKRKNQDYIMLLVKEFEMRKAASAYKRVKISDTGDISNRKLPFYKLTDDIFKKMAKIQKGKSHGLVLLLDRSGSMSGHIKGATEQILVLAMFCKKVNIPFAAYTFTSGNRSAKRHDFGVRHAHLEPFSKNAKDLVLLDVEFREIISSTMTAAQFTESCINQLVLSEIYSSGWRDTNKVHFDHPYHEGLGGTPLNEALIVVRDVLKNFKSKYSLDIVNTIIIHDGDADGRNSFYTHDRYGTASFHSYRNDVVTFVDTIDKINVKLPRNDRRAVTIALMKWIQLTTGSGVYGFYIVNGSGSEFRRAVSNYYHNKNGIKFLDDGKSEGLLHLTKLKNNFVDERFLESNTPGYNKFFFIMGAKDLMTEGWHMQDNGKAWTPSRLLSAFKKAGKRSQVSRVLVGRFIGMIATH